MIDFTKPKRWVTKCYLHCSASDNPAHDNIQTIRKWHVARGFDREGYHYFIQGNGNLQIGRPLEDIPAAQYRHNTGSIAICLHGHKPGSYNKAQRKTLHDLCSKINIEYNGKISFHGHNEVDPTRTCPVYDYKKWLSLTKFGRMPSTKKEIIKCPQVSSQQLPSSQSLPLSSSLPFLQWLKKGLQSISLALWHR